MESYVHLFRFRSQLKQLDSESSAMYSALSSGVHTGGGYNSRLLKYPNTTCRVNMQGSTSACVAQCMCWLVPPTLLKSKKPDCNGKCTYSPH